MTRDEAQRLVNRMLADAKIDQNEAKAMMLRFDLSGNIYSPGTPEYDMSDEGRQANAASFERMLSGENVEVIPTTKKKTKEVYNDFIDSLVTASDADLAAIVEGKGVQYNNKIVEEAQKQIEERARIKGLTFFETLIDPAALSRMGKAALKGPSQTVNAITSAIPGLLLSATGQEDAAASAFENFSEKNQEINDLFGVSDPLRAEESLAENITSALVPGGIGVKSATVAADFTVDQTIRELTDTADSPYETIYDRAGVLSPEAEGVSIPPLLVAPLAIAAGVGLNSVIKRTLPTLNVTEARDSVVVQPPKLVDVINMDKFAPPDLQSLETSADALKAYVVSETKALKDMIARAGVGNIDEVDKTLSLNSHASANVRAREAINAGFTEINGKTYKVPVSVKQIYEAVSALPFEIRKKLEKYINAKDMLDDVRINRAKGLPGNHDAIEAKLLRDIAVNAAGVPNLKQFERAYQSATEAVRKLLGHDMLLPEQLDFLNANRIHYVPRNTTHVDPTAPFMTRMIQTQKEGTVNPEDWFLMARESSGDIDLDALGSPFEQLAGYTEAALKSVMKNDARKTVVDAIMNSEFGKTTMRLFDETKDKLEGNLDRIVEVYRNGVKEKYITSSLQAQLLRFDPYIAKHPTFFAIKRLVEWNSVGPGNPLFAPVTAIRDMIGGAVTRKAGIETAGPIGTVAAIPKQLWSRFQQTVATNIYAGIASGKQWIPESVWSRASRLEVANKMSDRYLNSLYHLANQSGGFDGSIMRSNIEFAKNAFGEIKRTLSENALLPSPALDNAVTRFGVDGVKGIVSGMLAMFDSIQNAPRFAALEKTVKAGTKIDDAIEGARSITGDVAESGRVYRPDGKVIAGDYVDQGVTSYVMPGIGRAANFIRESTPFVNPSIQGTRNLIRSFKEDPAGTIGRAWLYAGLPSVAFYSWNEMLGEEYNDYAMNRRSANDIAMNMYIGLPGKPPEEGIEVPLPHELLMFSSPYTRMLHALLENEDRRETSVAMQTLGAQILHNSLEVGVPTFLQVFDNLRGQRSAEGIFDYISPPESGFYGNSIQEDNVGFLPQNLEQLARTLFSANGDTAIQLAYSFSGESEEPFNDFITNVYDNIKKRSVIVKGITGSKTANVTYSLPAEYDRQLETAMSDFMDYFREHTLMLNDDGLQAMGSIKTKKDGSRPAPNYTKDENLMDGREDLPRLMIGPSKVPEPLNPLYPIIGQLLYDNIQTNGIGISGLDDRNDTYKGYIAQLRAYNAGDKAAIKEWTDKLASIENPKDEATQELKDWIGQFNLDLTKFEDRVKLINIIENERSYIIRQKLEAIKSVEQQATLLLQEQGMLPEGETFDLLKHMDPMDASPFD